MKTNVPFLKMLSYPSLVIILLFLSFSVKAQTYTTIANGAWSNAATWQGGTIPDATNIPAAAVINIRHIVTYSGANINNYGTINILNQTGLVPRLIVASGITLTNYTGGKMYIRDAEYRQFRFAGGGETGTAQTGTFLNKGGLLKVENSYIEVADDWSNTNFGIRYVKNSSVTAGGGYIQTSNATDTLLYTSVSLGWHGIGDFSITGSSVYFQSARIQIADAEGVFKLNGCIANGDIDYITFKNHVTNTIGMGTLTASNSVTTAGLNLDAYCVAIPANYINSYNKFSGTQTPDCSQNYFPATLFASITPGTLNFSSEPVLIAGIDKKVGAQYKYQGVAPGIDAIVKIDSLVNGATVTMLDDNTAGAGFIEGFQPQITSGSATGESYAVFSFTNKITGTNVSYPLATFTMTGLDIDGTSTLKEFQEIGMGPGATASYILSNPQTLITQVAPGTFRSINISGVTVNGLDTTTKAHMFTVTNSNVSNFTVKMGIAKTTTGNELRLFSIYFKGFVYPYLATLPVSMESFTATLNNNGNRVDLNWVTASENNLSHFVVERSTDGINYSDAGVLFTDGNTTEKTKYSFPDDVTYSKSSLLYYRIRSVDHEGNKKYSEIRIIRLNKFQDQNVSVLTYPNPVTNELRVTLPVGWQNKPAVIEVYTANGQVVSRKAIASSSQTETINVSSLSPALYFISVKCNGETAQQKIIKR